MSNTSNKVILPQQFCILPFQKCETGVPGEDFPLHQTGKHEKNHIFSFTKLKIYLQNKHEVGPRISNADPENPER